MFLHAESIEFVLPSTQQQICVKAPIDEDLTQCLAMLAQAERKSNV
jgi:hypothetical protein